MKRAGRSWAVAVALVAAWAVLGVFCASPQTTWLLKAALAGSVLAPAAWIAIYTVQGMAGPGKWWRSDLGTNMVWLEIAAICTNGVIASALFFPHLLAVPALTWIYAGGLIAGAVIITWRSVIWLRGYRKEPPLLARVRELENELIQLRQRLGEQPGTP